MENISSLTLTSDDFLNKAFTPKLVINNNNIAMHSNLLIEMIFNINYQNIRLIFL